MVEVRVPDPARNDLARDKERTRTTRDRCPVRWWLGRDEW